MSPILVFLMVVSDARDRTAGSARGVNADNRLDERAWLAEHRSLSTS